MTGKQYLAILTLAAAAVSAGFADDGQASLPFVVVDTGQDTCYDDSGSITCPAPGEPFYGQDAQYHGASPNYVDNGDGTVSDLNTGLMWQKSPDMDGDGDIDAADKLSYAQALAGAHNLSLGGYTDWRLPSIKELYSLIDFSGIDPSGYEGSDSSGLIPFINTKYFDFGYGDTSASERIIDAQFATSTKYVSVTMGGAATMFGVNFADGRIKGYPSGPMPGQSEDKKFYVLYVRGNTGYGVNSFTDNGDGTVTDEATGLMWSQDDSGVGLDWAEALAWVEQKNAELYLGHDDWRLPNVKELQSIVDYTRSPDTTGTPAIDPAFNTTSITNEAGQTDYPSYWSGTTHANWSRVPGRSACYVSFGRAMGYMRGSWLDVHGAGAQRGDPKAGDPADWPTGLGPQGDAIRIDNYVRLVRGSGMTASAVTNAASFAEGAVAPGSIVSLFGQSLSTETVSATETPLPTTLGGLTLSITDSTGTSRECPQFLSSPAQCNFLIPAGTATGQATLTVSRDDGAAATIALLVNRVAPGLFTMNANGQGVGAIRTLRETPGGSRTESEAFQYDPASQTFVTSPIDLGDGADRVYLLLFGTGISGFSDLSAISVTIGGEPVPVIGAAAQGEFDGLDQVNVGPLPSTLAGRGEVALELTVDGVSANPVTVNLHP